MDNNNNNNNIIIIIKTRNNNLNCFHGQKMDNAFIMNINNKLIYSENGDENSEIINFRSRYFLRN